MRIASVGSSSFDPTLYIDRLVSAAGLEDDLASLQSGTNTSALFDLAAAGLEALTSSQTGEDTETPNAAGSASPTASSGGASSGGADSSSGTDTSTDTTVTVTETPTATITTTTTTTTYTASDGTVSTSTTSSTSTKVKENAMASMLYQSQGNAAQASTSNTLNIQA